MSIESEYGLNKAGDMRLFLAQIICPFCSDRMIVSKKDSSAYVCRSHPEYQRLKEEVETERRYFEFVRERLYSLGVKQVMVHEMDGANFSRGKFLHSTSVNFMADPSFSAPVFMAISQVLRDIGQETTKYAEQTPASDGLFGLSWRIVNFKSGDMLRILEKACQLVKNGFYAREFIIESVLSEDDESYVDSQIILQNTEFFSEPQKETADQLVKSYKSRLPRR